MDRWALFGLTVLTITAFADDEIAFGNKSSKNKKASSENSSPVAMSSAAFKSDHGWYTFGDALYWHASVGGTDWAGKVSDGTAIPTVGVMQHLDFKWDWGFRLGVGKNLKHDYWDTNLAYTWFQTHNSDAAAVGSTGFITDNFVTGIDIVNGKINWDIDFSMFDWEIGRWYYFSKSLAFRPHIGIKGGWISQDIKTHFKADPRQERTAVKFVDHFKNDFWGVGGSIGFNTLWVLGHAGMNKNHRFSFFGDFAAALMYGHFSVDCKHDAFDAAGDLAHQPIDSFQLKNLDRNLEATMMQGIFGFSWDTSFNKEKNHFAFKLGYEFQYWFRQNQLINAESTPPDTIQFHRLSEDLGLQGLTADFRFDF